MGVELTEPRLVPLRWSRGRLVPVPGLSLSARSDGVGRLTLLHSTDFHSSIDGRRTEEGRRTGGLARIAWTVNQVRQEAPTLVVDSGDSVFGACTWWDANGAGPVSRLRRLAGYDLAAIGNHDLDHGLHGL